MTVVFVIGGIVLLLYLCYYFKTVGKPPTLQYVETEKNKELLQKCPTLKKTYWPILFISLSSVMHSLIGQIVPPPPRIKYCRQKLSHPDGGTMSLDWFPEKASKPTVPIVFILPGFEGGSNSAYIRHFVRALNSKGYISVVFNFRGYADQELTSPKYHDLGSLEDMNFAVNILTKEAPNVPLIAIGYSMGANLLVKYLAEVGSDVPFIGAISAANPYDLDHMQRHHEDKPFWIRVFYEIYHTLALWKLKAKVFSNKKVFEACSLDFDKIKKAKTLPEFSDSFSRVLYKYDSVGQYYSKASCNNYLIKPNSIKIPLLCLSSLDDPLVPPTCIPYAACRQNQNIILATTSVGGHLGWLNNKGGKWLNQAAKEYIAALLDIKKEQ